MAQDSPSRKQDQYIVRFPDGMRDRLKAAASENGRSMNAEIVQRLEDSFAPPVRAYDEEAQLEIEAGKVRGDALMDVIRLLMDVIGEGVGGDPKVISAIAEGIRSIDKAGSASAKRLEAIKARQKSTD